MDNLTDEADSPHGCTEGALLEEHGFSVGELATLVYRGLAKLRPAGRHKKVFVLRITSAGRMAIAE
jgi:hypothetical protein